MIMRLHRKFEAYLEAGDPQKLLRIGDAITKGFFLFVAAYFAVRIIGGVIAIALEGR